MPGANFPGHCRRQESSIAITIINIFLINYYIFDPHLIWQLAIFSIALFLVSVILNFVLLSCSPLASISCTIEFKVSIYPLSWSMLKTAR
ncbi:hypothetical protein CP500_005565 [Tychonema bourrellyi FEM_GT703]|uniref:Uncharacterized protein n=1 Tax=Tychonema bourrellyi FEM_GT703 TaxID=2040638 RepID=A0A2G4F3M7_9CYAN|nr:hypothetical protein CP500_005565 [Tychonema bourrellyi FEM_GT703]